METHDHTLEDRLRRLEAELRQVRELVDDLAADNRQVHARLAELVTALERARAREDAELDGRDPLAGALGPEYARAQGQPRPILVRAAKAMLRGSLGLARRAWQASDPGFGARTELRFSLEGVVERLPRVGLVTIGSGAGEGDVARMRAVLGGQTDREYGLAAWDSESGTYQLCGPDAGPISSGTAASDRELVAALGLDYLIDAADLPSRLEPGFVESLRWLLASEGLEVVLLHAPESRPLAVVAAWLWRAAGGVDLLALAARLQRSSPAIVGKVVGGNAAPGFALPLRDPLGPGSSELVRQVGRHLVAGSAACQLVEGRLVALGRSPEPRPDSGGRGTVLLVLGAPLEGGLEERMAALVSGLADELRFVIAVMDPGGPLGAARARALGRLTPHLYPVGTWFEPELWPSLLEHLVVRFGAGNLLLVGEGPWSADLLGGLRDRFPGLRIVHQTVAGGPVTSVVRPLLQADLYLAVTAAAGEALRKNGAAPDAVRALPPELVAGRALTGERGVADRETLRAELGLPLDATVATMVADLVPEKRPEDFVDLARRLQSEEGLFFLLVGEGPLAPTLRDLADVFSLSRLALRAPVRSLAEVVAASDVVCSTSESEPTPTWLLAALAVGRPVVATAVDDVASLLDRYGDGRSKTVPVADPGAMEQAVRAAAAAPPAPPAAGLVERMRAEQRRGLELLRQALTPRSEPGD